MRTAPRALATSCSLLLAITAAGEGQSPPATPPQGASSTSSSPDWLVVDGAAHTVRLTLTVSPGTPAALLNGHRSGDLQVTVPLNWTIEWQWQSLDSSAAHSLVVMVEREKVPTQGGQPAFSNAMTRMVTTGLRPGQTDRTTFVADQAGWYWMLCGVPEHALNGEWISLRVDPEAKDVVVRSRRR